MSISKSSVLNLFDAISGTNHYQQKVSSDRVDLACPTLPINVKATSVNILNENGSSVLDVVKTMLDTIQSVSQEASDRAQAISQEASLRTQANIVLQTALNQEHADMLSAVLFEKTRAMASELVLTNDLVSESAARSSAITSEISARSNADQTLTTNLTQEIQDRTNAVLAEKSAREAGMLSEITTRSGNDALLQSAIDNEATSRTTNDQTLQTNIALEISNRISGDINLANDLVSEESSREIADQLEKDARISSDGVLQTNIDLEKTARVVAVNVESLARSTADESLAAAVVTEKNARLAEVNVERLRIDSLLAGTSVDLNQLQELITAYTTSDTSILAQIAAITTNIAAIQAQLLGTDSKLNSLIDDIALNVAAVVVAAAAAISVPQLTSNTSTIDGQTYTIDHSSRGGSMVSMPGWYAFNDTAYCFGPSGMTDIQNGVQGNFLKLSMSEIRTVSSYSFQTPVDNQEKPKSWVLFYSMDGTTYTLADDRRNGSYSWPGTYTGIITFPSFEAKHLLLIVTENTNGDYSCIKKLVFA